MAKIERSLGGAGTGKTRQILAKMNEAKRELRLSVDQIGFATFTRAGRAEISERAAAEWGVDAETLNKAWFRTAHSIAHKCLGVEEGRLISGEEGDQWLSGALGGSLAVKLDSRGERTYVSGNGGEPLSQALQAWDLARARMCSVGEVLQRWEASGNPALDQCDVEATVKKYEQAKKREDRLDFTDMIGRYAGVKFGVDGPQFCTPEGEVPEGLRVLAIDEAQDSSHLVDRVCRRLAASDTVERIWISGDPFQSIHSFAGGDYRLFLSWDAEESIMPRSYRCPNPILQLGERCLRQMKYGYRDRGIAPAEHDGVIQTSPDASDAISHALGDSSVLILGRCKYSLDAYENYLVEKGIPYSWVDKAHGTKALSGYAALWSLEHGEPCRGEDFGNAVSLISVKDKELGELLFRGEKTAWASGKRNHVDVVVPEDWYYDMAGAAPALRDLIKTGRWVNAIEPKNRERAARWYKSAKDYGVECACNPRIRLSTIHSAKGLEADTVILSSIVSHAVERGRMALEDLHDEECRVAYVAVTRARRRFVYVDDASFARMEIPL